MLLRSLAYTQTDINRHTDGQAPRDRQTGKLNAPIAALPPPLPAEEMMNTRIITILTLMTKLPCLMTGERAVEE